MKKIEIKKYQKYAFFVFFLILIVLSFLVIRPFLTVILTSIIIAYIFYPLFRLISKRIRNKSVSAFLVMLIILVMFGLFSTLILNEIYKEVSNLTKTTSLNIFEKKCTDESLLCRLNNFIAGIIKSPKTKEAIIDFASRISKSLIISIPSFLLNILIFVFLTFYFFRDGEKIASYTSDLLPFKENFKEKLKKQTEEVVYSTIYGSIIVAMIQGSIGILAFLVFDSTKSPFFWGIIMAFAALIPFFGTGTVWLPMSVFQILSGYSQGSSVIMWKGIGLFLVGACIISSIDNILKPKIIGERAKIHPILVLLGALGGLAFIGPIGVFFGPLLLASLVSFAKVYRKEKYSILKC